MSNKTSKTHGTILGHFPIALLLLLLLPYSSHAQSNSDYYNYAVGEDESMWVNFDSDTCITSLSSEITNIGFNFYFMGHNYSQFYLGTHGEIMLGGPVDNQGYPEYPFYNNNQPGAVGVAECVYTREYITHPTIVPVGLYDAGHNNDWNYEVCYGIIGSRGCRVLVLTHTLNNSQYGITYRCQTQLYESNGVILFLYQPNIISHNTVFQIGFADSDNTIHTVNNSRQLQLGPTWSMWNTWFTQSTFMRFTPRVQPLCGGVGELHIDNSDQDHVIVNWSPSRNATSYIIQVQTADSTTNYELSDTTLHNSYHLPALLENTDYEITVTSQCPNNVLSIPTTVDYYNPSESYRNNPIKYADLSAPNVTCRTKGSDDMQYIDGRVDFGPNNICSRHTVHHDTSRHDPRTRNNLKVVPDGYSCVVRLGNWNTGGESEEVTYELTIDSNEYDLLLIHYAIVEEQPDHSEEFQPSFTVRITDSIGNLLGNCNYRNFVSGVNNSGSNEWQTSFGIAWHPWDVMGMDLGPYHGQRIQVTLSNSDCRLNYHYGYAYYMLEGTTKRLNSTACGDQSSNILTAPSGFDYRWYNANNPNITLTHSQSLTVNTPGTYCCQVTYIGNHSCGFTLYTVAGSRYPHAAMSIQPLTDCGNIVRFTDLSRVASDPEHTQITDLRCDSVTWYFGDGTSSTLSQPTHSFLPGDYTVTLIASLAGGQCNDTVTTQLHVDHYYDTVAQTICPNQTYLFHGTDYSNPGIYVYDSACTSHTLLLSHHPASIGSHSDSICIGGTYQFGDLTTNAAGSYEAHLANADINGCDSTVMIDLSTYLYDSTFNNLTICQGDTFHFGHSSYTLAGTYLDTFSTAIGCDSISVIDLHIRPLPNLEYQLSTVCEEYPYYRLLLEDTTCVYSFHSHPQDSCFAYNSATHELLLHPKDNTTYDFTIQYPDTPACAVVEHPQFDNLGKVKVDLKLWPEALTPDHLDFSARDMARQVQEWQWYIDGVQTDETGPQLESTANLDSTWVHVMLVGNTLSCADTATDSLPILRHSIFFPNVFSPVQGTNNTFRPAYYNISDYELWLYDRRGDLVFHTTDPDQGWDGTHQGQPVPQGVYVFTCRYSIPTDGMQRHTATVLLLR